MAKFQSTAEKAFNEQLSALIKPAVRRRHPDSNKPVDTDESLDVGNTNDVLIIPSEPLDVEGVDRVFFRYGTYLELVGGDGPAEKKVVVTASRGCGLTPKAS